MTTLPERESRPTTEAAPKITGEEIDTRVSHLAATTRTTRPIYGIKTDPALFYASALQDMLNQAEVGHWLRRAAEWDRIDAFVRLFIQRVTVNKAPERVPLVQLLAEQGMSTRAIAPIVGASKDTVSRDIRAGVSDETPAVRPDVIDGLLSAGMIENLDDLESVLRMGDASDEQFEAALTSAAADDDLSRENVLAKLPEKKIIGTDGKTYTKPEPKKPPRRPITDQARDAGWDLDKVLRRIGRIGEDDRFEANKAQVCKNLWTHLRGSVVLADKVFEYLAEDGFFDSDDSAFRLLMMSATNDLRRVLDRLDRFDRLDPGGHNGDLDHIRAQADKQLARADAIAQGWLR